MITIVLTASQMNLWLSVYKRDKTTLSCVAQMEELLQVYPDGIPDSDHTFNLDIPRGDKRKISGMVNRAIRATKQVDEKQHLKTLLALFKEAVGSKLIARKPRTLSFLLHFRQEILYWI